MLEAFDTSAAWRRAGAKADLAALARAPSPLRRALARIVARMVATRGWERLGFARLEDYAAERPGMSARELRDLAHVDQALRELRRLDAAFRTGVIGWTQLRLLCRVARPEDERAWSAMASQLTARALAREVRAVDRVAREADDGADGDARVGVAVRCTPAVRARWWHARQLANRVAGHALSPEAFVEALTAEMLSAVPLDRECEDAKRVPGEESRWNEMDGPSSRIAFAPPARTPAAFVATLERDLDSADAFELDARLCRAVRLEARWLAQVASRLEFVIAYGIHRDLGFRGLDAYADDRLGMAPSPARALLRIARAADRCPELHEAFATGRISWVQAHALIPLLLAHDAAAHRAAWVAHAERVSVRRLRDEVEAALANAAFAPSRLADPNPAGLQTLRRVPSARTGLAALAAEN